MTKTRQDWMETVVLSLALGPFVLLGVLAVIGCTLGLLGVSV